MKNIFVSVFVSRYNLAEHLIDLAEYLINIIVYPESEINKIVSKNKNKNKRNNGKMYLMNKKFLLQKNGELFAFRFGLR